MGNNARVYFCSDHMKEGKWFPDKTITSVNYSAPIITASVNTNATT